jgi:hypothetical protein
VYEEPVRERDAPHFSNATATAAKIGAKRERG